MMEELDYRTIAPLIAGAVSLAVFAASKLFELWRHAREHSNQENLRLLNEQQLVAAIFHEISYNLEDLKGFNLDKSQVDQIIEILEDDPKKHYSHHSPATPGCSTALSVNCEFSIQEH